MNVNFDGQTYSFEVKPGSAGYKQFTQAIREAFSLPEDSELNITFTCDEPSQGMMSGNCSNFFEALDNVSAKSLLYMPDHV